MTPRKGQLTIQDGHNVTSRIAGVGGGAGELETRVLAQDSWDRAVGTEQPGLDSHNRTNRIGSSRGQSGQESQVRSARTGKRELRQNTTVWAGQLGTDSQDSTTVI
jgi:hypothetical protein